MERVSFEELRLLDLRGNTIDLREHFRQHLLLIFSGTSLDCRARRISARCRR